MSFRIAAVALLAGLLLSLAFALPPDVAGRYEALRVEGERYYAEKSFARAHEAYLEAAKLSLGAEEAEWVRFRLADTAWRADAAAPAAEGAEREAALKTLRELADEEPAGRIAAEAAESLGDHARTLGGVRAAMTHYSEALEYWAASSELETARERYLGIVRRIADSDDPGAVPAQILTNAIEIATADEDRALARTVLALQYVQSYRPELLERALELFSEVIALGKKTSWYDDALFHSARILGREASVRVGADDDSATEDPVRALALYRKLVAEFGKGESRYRSSAETAIFEITRPQVGLQVDGVYLPGSAQRLLLTWRNVGAIDLAVYPVDLTADRIEPERDPAQSISVRGRKAERQWTYATNDRGEHRSGSDRIDVQPRLGTGAWLVVASAGGRTEQQLLLVSDTHVLVHKLRSRMQVFVSDVVDGRPIAGARVRVVSKSGPGTVEQSGITDANGLAPFDVKTANGPVVIAAAAGGSRQAWHRLFHYSYETPADRWRIYAFTDRPAYRPGETVSWKIVARTRESERWSTPAAASVAWEIVDPRGEVAAKGSSALNPFGSAWGELPLTASMPLGMYSVIFRTSPGASDEIGRAEFFRLEEYKLPEFFVRVTTPEGARFRLGETIEATVEAGYYFGGPVANATVTAVVEQQPYFREPWPWREYAWYFPPEERYRPVTRIREETVRTDANGRAVIRIDSPRDGGDATYRIEARVVDASRREVRGEGTVNVMRQRYAVSAQPEHYIHRPGEPASVDFRAVDANGRPVVTDATVTVVRLRRVAEQPRPTSKSTRMPVVPPFGPGEHYEETEVTSAKVSTDGEGRARYTFTPAAVGYYAVRWTGVDVGVSGKPKARDIVRTEAMLWVADRATTDVGYRTGGLDVIVDRESVRRGGVASMIVATPASGRWVVLTTSADEMLDTQVLHLDGTAKLVQVAVDERHVPNFFVTASSVFAQEVTGDTEQILVPPADRFVDVQVRSDRAEYRPRDTGTFTVTTRDSEGRPVAAEVALSVADEAVAAIQEDPAGDPRPFFFGDLRQQSAQVSASLHQQRYVRPEERDAEEKGEVAGGVMGGMAKDAAALRSAPPPPPSAAPVAEAITVTAQPLSLEQAASAAVAVGEPAVQVRSDFRSTAFWKPDVVTDSSGTATVTMRFPDALTTWRGTARAFTADTKVGWAKSESKTNLPLIVRLQAPRFFVAGDSAVISAVINNNTGAPMSVAPSLEAEGLLLRDPASAEAVTVPAHGDRRVDWRIGAQQAGEAKLRVSARAGELADAMERSFTVWEHGVDKLVASSGKLRNSEAVVRLDLPAERRATELVVQVAPSLATAMLDALPYLIDFPYGCTEQTMSRFLPAAMVARTLEKLGLDREAVSRRIAGVSGPPSRKTGAGLSKLDEATAAGMERLYDMQHDDGGWGWWKEGDSDAWMTAYVVWGFSIAREGGLEVRRAAVDEAARWLEQQLVNYEDRIDDQAWMLHALASWRAKPSQLEGRATENLWSKRERLSAYGRALLAMAVHLRGDQARARVLVRNLEDGAQVDRATGSSTATGVTGAASAERMETAHWGSSRRFWWRWQEGPVETTAFVLRALAAIEPGHRLVEPVMNWLVKNRRGASWSNTRDTAIALLALEDYLERSGELTGDAGFEVTVNGTKVAARTLRAEDVLAPATRFVIDPSLLSRGAQEIRIRRTSGKAPLYFSAEARFVSLEEPVKAAGNEVFVKREYFRLAPRPTLLKGVQYDRVPLADGAEVVSGERVEVVVTIDAKNDYDYLVFEDLKPAGLEAVELLSGEPLFASGPGGSSAWIHQELRDRKVASFATHLSQGVWQLRYTLRAETPGTFHALPLLASAMYVPDVRANSEEVRLGVREGVER